MFFFNIHIFLLFYLIIYVVTVLGFSDKIPDDKNFKNGSNNRQTWEADDTDEAYRNDTGMYSNSNGHVKFDVPRVPVIFVLGKGYTRLHTRNRHYTRL